MKVPVKPVIQLCQSLIRIPSQGGGDPCKNIVEALQVWMENAGVPYRLLYGRGQEPLALLVQIAGAKPGPTFCLNACIDTAPFGDLEAWDLAPTSAALINGWLYGRGSADSKVAVSIFCHLASHFKERAQEIAGTLQFLFDGDEHTGQFGGIKSYIENCGERKPDGVLIGYPGRDRIIIGARGFYRVELTTYGTAKHSGSSTPGADNAVVKAASLVRRLAAAELPANSDPDFVYGPKITVTEIEGGAGYSIVPDRCRVNVDIRLTPSFNVEKAKRLIDEVVSSIDAESQSRQPTSIRQEENWPAYKLHEDSPLVSAMRNAAAKAAGHSVPTAVCGPSNVGNYLAYLGVEATCGFGVEYKNLHAPNEGVDVSSIPLVYQTYYYAIQNLLTQKLRARLGKW